MSYWVELINLMGIYVILALSLNMICGMTGLLQLGHAGFFAVGAYTAGLISIYWLHADWGYMNFVLTAGGAMLMAAIFSLIIGIPCLRLNGDYLAIATLGFGEMVRISLDNITFPGCSYTGGEAFGGATGIELPEAADYVHTFWNNPMGNGPFHAFFERLQTCPFDNAFAADVWELILNCWFIWLFVLISFVLLVNLKRSALGRAFLAIREDEIAARVMGVNLPRYKMLAFIFSAMFAGLAGALYAHMQTTLAPSEFTLMQTIMVLLMVVLGGLGSFTGSAVAAVILVGLPELLRLLPSFLSRIGMETSLDLAKYQQILFALLLILLVRWAPHGLFGMREIDELLFRRRQSSTPDEGKHA